MNKVLEKKLNNQIKQFEKETKDHLAFVFHKTFQEISELLDAQNENEVQYFLTSSFFNNLNGLDLRLSLHSKTRLNSKTLEAFAKASRNLNDFDDITFVSFNLEIVCVQSDLNGKDSASVIKETFCVASANSILELIPIINRCSICDVLKGFPSLKKQNLGKYQKLLKAKELDQNIDEKAFLDGLDNTPTYETEQFTI